MADCSNEVVCLSHGSFVRKREGKGGGERERERNLRHGVCVRVAEVVCAADGDTRAFHAIPVGLELRIDV